MSRRSSTLAGAASEDALTRTAARAGFEMGAATAWLGASEMGAGLYRRIGFEDLVDVSALVELESPTT
jgi:hypothetical protein